MTNQDIVDEVENILAGKIPARVLEKILDHVWDVLNDELGIDLRKNS